MKKPGRKNENDTKKCTASRHRNGQKAEDSPDGLSGLCGPRWRPCSFSTKWISFPSLRSSVSAFLLPHNTATKHGRKHANDTTVMMYKYKNRLWPSVVDHFQPLFFGGEKIPSAVTGIRSFAPAKLFAINDKNAIQKKIYKT